ncbi:unnamed protein product [Clonostachys rhizophaga]|uniref:Cupin type-2 domain-containing protein n=1 Tax=Clonostachys rhizophaga TaxID=160324 RepID=A0A9N9VH95_9HYPO|nr:unnamed protein product [Clonostachys rhizophaga]
MTSFLPLISELLPMILPSSIHVVRAKDLQPKHPTVEGPVLQRQALVGKCGMCATVLTIRPHSESAIRHNSEQDAIVFLVSGSGVFLVQGGQKEGAQRNELTQGDLVFVPSWTEHQLVNETDDDAVWLLIQSGSRPVGADLTDWGGDEVFTRK